MLKKILVGSLIFTSALGINLTSAAAQYDDENCRDGYCRRNLCCENYYCEDYYDDNRGCYGYGRNYRGGYGRGCCR